MHRAEQCHFLLPKINEKCVHSILSSIQAQIV